MNNTIMDAIVFLPIKPGQVATIDFEDLDKPTRFGTVRESNWLLNPKGYIYKSHHDGDKSFIFFLHNFVLDRDPKRGQELHHKNGDKLDNRKCNLEEISKANHKLKHSRTKNYNVSEDPRYGTWSVRFTIKGKRYGFGAYKFARLAKLIADKKVLEYIGPDTILNYPELSAEERQQEISFLLREQTKIK